MRTIFTERDRRLLLRWLDDGVETGETRKLFTEIRRGTPLVLQDLSLMGRVILELKRMRRWRGRAPLGREYALASRRVASASTRPRRGGATSSASRT